MQFTTFFIPLGDAGQAQDELNAFLRSKRVLAVDKALGAQGWSFCVEWLEGGKPSMSKRPKIDYREILSAAEFDLFSALRDQRKELAHREGVQLYTVMTNEQLADMVRLKIKAVSELTKIPNMGAARIEKYGAALLKVLNEAERNDDV